MLNDLIETAERIESLVRRSNMFGPKTREEILEELLFVAEDLRKQADSVANNFAEQFGQ